MHKLMYVCTVVHRLVAGDLHRQGFPRHGLSWCRRHGKVQLPRLFTLIPSNGIRFSITDLSIPTTRTMPTIFAERAAISLYDVQHPKASLDKIAIPEDTIREVLKCMLRFKGICEMYNVPGENVVIVATEATRYLALNALRGVYIERQSTLQNISIAFAPQRDGLSNFSHRMKKPPLEVRESLRHSKL
jgi:hypothetical protein